MIDTYYSRYLAGDIGALDPLLAAGRKLALSIARRLRVSDPEEIAQTATVKMWKSIRNYDPSRSSIPTWIGSIVRSVSIDLHRASPQPAEELDEATLPEPPRIDYLTLDTSHLTDQDRRTLAVFVLDPDFDTAAKTLGISVAALKKRLHRIAAKKSRLNLSRFRPLTP